MINTSNSLIDYDYYQYIIAYIVESLTFELMTMLSLINNVQQQVTSNLVLFLSEKEPAVFPFSCWVLNKETIGTIFIVFVVWRCQLIRVEPWDPRTWSQLYHFNVSTLVFVLCFYKTLLRLSSFYIWFSLN